MNWKALVVAVTLVVSAVGTPVAAAATTNAASSQSSAQAQSGTYVSFETADSAVVDYTVNGKTVVDRLSVQSTSEAKSQVGGDLGVGGDVGFSGAGLSLASSFQAGVSTTATIQSESGAEIITHDNDRGIVVVESNGESHVARFNSSDGSEAEQASEKRAVITSNDGATATVIVVGDGNVSVSDGGNVTATAEEDARVVYRQYEGERNDSEKQQERLIANGTAVAEVYVQAAGDAASDAGDDDSDETPTATDSPTEEPSEEAEERSADVVRYSEDTTVEVTENAAGTFNATVERSQSEGKVVIMSVSEAAFENAENAEVYVDGEAAAEASSYSEVQSATNDGETSKYLVRSSSSAEASTDVVVGINHFSAREVSMQSGGDGGGAISGGQPGFGAAIAVIALVGAALLARRQA
ncbi:PGF-CTERM sorting domain-containing protein [Haloglomus salinum]|uniref:PGF-CTERM sorting domain-containing protein n=1 Tax=Haloglomus salinum TaxID=2962673 RepID=UPI0020C96FE9|nr:PGF-CTERM sorting domain-containing protein [Haloglomus salinum]